MANIPVKKKSGFPWWIALLALVVVAGLIWLFMEQAPEAEDALATDDTEQLDGQAVATADVDADVEAGPLVMTGMLYDPADETLVGREVEVSDLRVVNVLGDVTFTVAAEGDPANTALVVLDQEMTPGAEGVEGRYDINAGQTVALFGSIQELTASDVSSLDLQAPGADSFSAGDRYIRAQRVEISGADLENVEVGE